MWPTNGRLRARSRSPYATATTSASAPHWRLKFWPACWGVTPPDALDSIATNFRSAPRNLHLCDGKPIVDHKWAVPSPGIASRIGDAVAARDIGLLPVAEPLGQSDDDTNDGIGDRMRPDPDEDGDPSP